MVDFSTSMSYNIFIDSKEYQTHTGDDNVRDERSIQYVGSQSKGSRDGA